MEDVVKAPSHSQRLGLLVGLLVGLLMGGCEGAREGRDAEPEAADAAARPTLALWGYRAVGAERWLFDAERRPTIRVDGPASVEGWAARWRAEGGAAQALPVTATARMGGWLLAVAAAQVPEGPGALSLLDARGQIVGRWAAVWAPPPDQRPAHQAAVAMRDAGRLDEASRWLRAEIPQMARADRLWAQVELGRVLGRQGDQAAACEAWRAAAEIAAAEGWRSEAGARHRACAYYALVSRDWAAVDAALAEAAGFTPAADGSGRLRAAYYAALSMMARSKFYPALSGFEAAYELARRGGGVYDLLSIGIELAELYARLGLTARAEALIDPLLGHAQACEAMPRAYCLQGRARLLGIRLVSRADRPEEAQPTAEALRILAAEAERLEVGDALSSALISLAWHAYQRGQLSAAKDHLARLRRRAVKGGERFSVLIEAEYQLAEGALAAAEAGFKRLLSLSESAPARDLDLVWRARLGAARIHKARGQGAEAAAAYREAVAALVAAAQHASARLGASSYVAEHRRVFEEALLYCEDQGDVGCVTQVIEQGLSHLYLILRRVARQGALQGGQAGALRSEIRRLEADIALAYDEAEIRLLEQRAADLSRDLAQQVEGLFYQPGAAGEIAERRRPEDREVITIYPLSEGCMILVEGAGVPGLHRQTLKPCGEGQIVAALEAVAPGRAEPLWVVSPLRPVDLGALPVAGAPLMTRRPVLRAVPVPSAGPAQGARPEAGLALLYDPELNLPEARREARRLSAALKGQGVSAELVGGASVDRAAMSAALKAHAVVHFAGHGVIQADDPWTSHLRLHGGERLTAEEVLQLEVRAEAVVLNGCETGGGGQIEGGARMGLPEAFLIAGARYVIGAEKKIEDGASMGFMTDFYTLYPARGVEAAFHEAQRRAQARGDGIWRVIRLWARI